MSVSDFLSAAAAQRAKILSKGAPSAKGPAASAVEKGDELARNQRLLDNASRAVALAPDLLGASGPRHYFVAFMTPFPH